MNQETGSAGQPRVTLQWGFHTARDEKKLSFGDFVFILNLTKTEAASWVYSNVSKKNLLCYLIQSDLNLLPIVTETKLPDSKINTNIWNAECDRS